VRARVTGGGGGFCSPRAKVYCPLHTPLLIARAHTGESHRAGAERGLKEELGIDARLDGAPLGPGVHLRRLEVRCCCFAAGAAGGGGGSVRGGGFRLILLGRAHI
jgi:hypothetical protein